MAQSLKVLIVGGGGREHALAWRLKRDNPDVEIIAAPGNPGIATIARCVAVPPSDIDALTTLARQEAVDWTLVGPEAPLAAGLVDWFRLNRLAVFGPTRAGALLETSKAFSKALMLEAGVPTARAATCRTLADAERAITEIGAPVVVKASGLAAGKGVIMCSTAQEAVDAATAMLNQNMFGDAGNTILVEELMEGEELSMFFVTDGERSCALPPAQDHKRLLEGDRGPNTGGMGAYAPVPHIPGMAALQEEVRSRIVQPTLHAMQRRRTPFTGVLYVGLMLTAEGPKVVEFNCRFGDPETQAVLVTLAAGKDVGEVMRTIAHGGKLPADSTFSSIGAAVTTVTAASGYPDKPRTGDRIDLPAVPQDVFVFHAGTRRGTSGDLVTGGGRVLAITGYGSTFERAQQRSLEYADAVRFEGKQYRPDIGWRELARNAGVT